PKTDPVHKVTIIPRGMALGLTQQLPGDDRHNYNKEYLENNLVMLLGGRVAEELVLDQMTTGASNDIERATKTARNMVCQWGMSEKLGPLTFGDSNEQVFLGKELIQHKSYSEDTARLIDEEVRRIIESSYVKAKALLSGNLEILHRIADALLERETVTGEEIDLLIKGEDLPPSTLNGRSRSNNSGPGYSPARERGGSGSGGDSSGDSGDFLLEEEPGQDREPDK
ncbi:MAG: cell division protein FtsH, partial [Desulfovibrionaceae bacterium]|nr:cell division protein FtsH [Desulfovibrionaceae bacterium]